MRNRGPNPEMMTSAAERMRADYRKIWGREWPYDAAYLTLLWHETKALYLNARGNARVPNEVMRQYCLTLMRECHEFEPGEAA